MGETVGRAMEILLVEDNLRYAGVILDLLRASQGSHRATLARDAEEALAFVRREGVFARAPRPDLILLDLHLPKTGGWELLAEIRACGELAEVMVVVVTASMAAEDLRRAEAARIDAYLAKPLNPPEFVATIQRLRCCWREGVVRPALLRPVASDRALGVAGTGYSVLST